MAAIMTVLLCEVNDFDSGVINELTSSLICLELESGLRDTVDWGKKWLVDFSAGETQLVSFDRCNNTGSIDVKIDGSVLEQKSSFKMLELMLHF